MLVELSMVEQRYQAVREVLDSGATITEVAKHYGVDRRTLHRWLTRYANGGLEALVTQSTRPDTCPHQMDPVIEARLVERRRMHPTWGPRTLATKLRAEFGERAPSRAAIYRALRTCLHVTESWPHDNEIDECGEDIQPNDEYDPEGLAAAG